MSAVLASSNTNDVAGHISMLAPVSSSYGAKNNLSVDLGLSKQQPKAILIAQNLPKANSVPTAKMDMSQKGTMNKKMMDHSHIPIAAPKSAPYATLSISVAEDIMSGYNLKIQTENFRLIPPPRDVTNMEVFMKPTIDKSTGFIEGHAHLYINGEKIQRIYGNNIHLPASLFRNGINQINVTLNNHAHMYWTQDDKKVLSTLFINAETDKLLVHQFDSFPTQ